MSEATKLNSDKMRSTPICSLLITMSLPAIISMLVQAFYNVMDTVYVGMYYSNISETEYNSATQALSVAFPMQLIIVAIGLGVGVGANACISKKLGEGDGKGASQIAKHAILLALISGILLVPVGLFLSKPFVSALSDVSGNSGNALLYGTQYLTIVTALALPSTVELTLSRLFQATGNMRVPMISQAMGAIINIALDPVLIFVFNMGVSGAAIATVFSQICSMVFSFIMFIVKKQDVSISPKDFKFNISAITSIINVGFPALVTNAIGAVTYVMLLLIMKSYAYGSIPQQVFGLYFKIESIVFMPTFGLMQGALPILGYNYGASCKKRFVECLKYMVLFSEIFMVIGVLLFELAPEFLLGLFSANAETLREGVLALRIIAICFPFAAVGIVIINAYQALQCGVRALLMSVLRQLGIIVPFSAIFGQFGSYMIWVSYPVAELTPTLIFLPMLFGVIRKKFNNEPLR